MADLTITDAGELVLKLSAVEHLEGFHGDITVPLAAVTAVRVVPDAWTELRGIRAPGTGFPGVIAVGTRRGAGAGEKDFAAVHGQGAGVVVELEGQEFSHLVLSADDPETIASRVRAALPR
jgi:hypothetical protein